MDINLGGVLDPGLSTQIADTILQSVYFDVIYEWSSTLAGNKFTDVTGISFIPLLGDKM